MTARFAIKGVRKSYSCALFHACGGCSAPRCLYKVTKKSWQLQTARKNLGENPMLYAGFGKPITGNEKKIAPEMLKIQPRFLDIAGHTWT